MDYLGQLTNSISNNNTTLTIIWYVLLIIAQWKIFEKAGEKGWKSLIPIYGQYILFKIAGAKAWFWALFCITIVACIVIGVNNIPVDYNATSAELQAQLNAVDWTKHVPYLVAIVAGGIISIASDIALALRLARAFGKGFSYVLGLIFIPQIVTLVLGFGKAKYSAKNLK